MGHTATSPTQVMTDLHSAPFIEIPQGLPAFSHDVVEGEQRPAQDGFDGGHQGVSIAASSWQVSPSAQLLDDSQAQSRGRSK